VLKNILPVLAGDLAEKFSFAKKADLSGGNLDNMLMALQRHFRNLLLIKIGAMSDPNSRMQANEANYTVEKLKKIIRLIGETHHQLVTTNASAKLALEVLLLEIN